jgi:hypothetical protein
MVREHALFRSRLVHRTLLVWIGWISVFGLNTLGQSTTSLSGSTQPNASARKDAHELAPEGSDQIMKAYGDAQPYMDCTLPQLQRIVPALEGLKPEKGQLQLQSILNRTGEVIQAQIPKMPDLIARESVAQVDVTGAKSPGTGALYNTSRGFPQVAGLLQQYSLQFGTDEKQLEQNLHLTLVTETPWKDFDYLILARRSSDGAQVLEESRTDLKAPNGKRLKHEQKILHGIGFEYLWLLFLPGNAPQSSYRLLGQQKMFGHETYVVGFAQSPARVKLPGEIDLSGQAYPLLYQGIAWIDETTFSIVRLRTDLLAPLPAIHLERFSSDLRFEKIDITGLNLSLWLPWQVELIWTQAGQLSGELHVYTKYSLFHATVRILPPA